jgi:hypothetical protein
MKYTLIILKLLLAWEISAKILLKDNSITISKAVLELEYDKGFKKLEIDNFVISQGKNEAIQQGGYKIEYIINDYDSDILK